MHVFPGSWFSFFTSPYTKYLELHSMITNFGDCIPVFECSAPTMLNVRFLEECSYFVWSLLRFVTVDRSRLNLSFRDWGSGFCVTRSFLRLWSVDRRSLKESKKTSCLEILGLRDGLMGTYCAKNTLATVRLKGETNVHHERGKSADAQPCAPVLTAIQV